MAQEELSAQSVTRSGAQMTMNSVTTADGFKFANNGRTLLIVANDASALALAFAIQITVDSEVVDPKDVTVTASQTWPIGPFPKNIYNDADGNVVVTIDADLANGIAVLSVQG